MKWLERLRARLHRHSWWETAWNPYGYPAEARCDCGAYRHRWPDPYLPIGAMQPWEDGPHPTAVRLRAEGRTSTDDGYTGGAT